MHRVVAQQKAVSRVPGVGRLAPDRVAWVDIPQVDRYAQPTEEGPDLIAEKKADIAEADVAGGVLLAGPRHQVLPGPFGHDDDGMAPFLQSLPEGFQEGLESEGDLGHE